MKFALAVIGLAVTLAGIQMACGPEEKYCYDQHTTCKQAAIEQKARDDEAKENARKAAEAGEGMNDGGATVIGQ